MIYTTGWVDISEATPKSRGRWCLVCDASMGEPEPWVEIWDGENWCGYDKSYRVTHWMPVPSLPMSQGGFDE